MQQLGLIKWFDNDKGFGKIVTTEGLEVFAHSNHFVDKPEKILKAKAVFFDIIDDKKGKKAINITNPETSEHFLQIMAISQTNPKVNIEFTVKGKSKWGNEYIRKEFQDFSIFNYAIYQLLRNKDPKSIKEFYIHFFNKSVFETEEQLNFLFQNTREILNKLNLKISIIDNNKTIEESYYSPDLIQEIFKYYLTNIKENLLFSIWKKSNHHPLLQSNSFIHEKYESYFIFPTKIFLENYKEIDEYALERLLKNVKREDICYTIIDKKIDDFNESNDSLYRKIKKELFVLLGTDSFNSLDKKFRQKNLDNFIQDKDKIKDSTSFEKFINQIKVEYLGNQKEEAVNYINSKLDNDTILKYWKKLNYFNPSIEFIERNFESLTYKQFANAPIEFHQKFFLEKYYKLKFDNSIEAFAHVLFLVFQTPHDFINLIIQDFSNDYKTALWLFGVFKNQNNYENKNSGFNFDYSIKDFVSYLDTSESLENVLDILKIIVEIEKECQTQKKDINTAQNFFNKFTESERINILNDCLNKTNKFDSFKVLTWFINRWDDKRFNIFLELFIPKYLDPEIAFNDIIKEEYFIKIDTKRVEFYNYIAKYLSDKNKITLWVKNLIYEIDLNLVLNYLKTNVTEFQFIYLKKIFAIIHSDKSLITENLYNQFKELAKNKKLNLEVRIALFVLLELKEQDKYITDKTIFELVSQYLNENVEEFVKIDHLFDKCSGRTWKAYSYSSDEKEKWLISINNHEFPIENNQVYIEGNSYIINREKRTINIDGNDYYFKWIKEDNHFKIKKYEIPEGIKFCDASKSQFDEDLKVNFYWCCNSKCYSPCQKDYNLFQWRRFTLRDFIKILNLPFNEDLYYRFTSVVNRVIRLLEKLKCNSCAMLMRDASSSEFAFYRVNTFHCTNTNCKEYHQKVYLTHCLNWRCLNVIDSRISKACDNGWYICDKCDSCCSHEKIESRYQNLLTNAAFNPNNPRHQKLKFQVDNHLGHLEREVVFDYKTGKPK